MKKYTQYKGDFKEKLQKFLETIISYVSTPNGQWSIKGFIDVYKNIYTISSDTKIVSKILEIHLFPKILEFFVQAVTVVHYVTGIFAGFAVIFMI